MKIILLVSSLSSLALLASVAYRENFHGEWRGAQERYRERLLKTASDDHARRAAASFEVEPKQLFLPDLASIDRCTTCHLGVENPGMEKEEQPLRTHPGSLLAYHPLEKFGCTVCHQGQGRAVAKEQAHGWREDKTATPHVEKPLLRREAIYTSCGKCHYETDLFGGAEDFYAAGEQKAGGSRGKFPIEKSTLELALPGAESLEAGKRLAAGSGCLGCHKYRGRGGVLGPDITYVGDKTIHDFDFRRVKGERTVEQWLYEHFMLPGEISPGTVMPNLDLKPGEARQLAIYMLSLHRKSAPASHRPRPPARAEERPLDGETLYNLFCSSCHGVDGHGSTMRTGLWPLDADPWGHHWDSRRILAEKRGDMEVFVPSLNHPDTLAVASEDYLRLVISSGRPGTKMIAWAEQGGLAVEEIDAISRYLLNWNPRPPDAREIASVQGDPAAGAALYRANCSGCHGPEGEGGIGISLNSPTFLAVASDAFLRDTILHGRPNTAMPAWREFGAQEVGDLLAYIRSWQPARGDLEGALRLCSGEETAAVSGAIGKILFEANCVMCHGPQGEGDLGPSLNTQEFLTAVPDEYLLATLLQGRPGTAMPSWRHLANEDLASIVRHLRAWQKESSRPREWRNFPVEAGDAYTGQHLFVEICSGCHGREGEGATGPQLNNPVFLRSATDRMLEEWIAYGKGNTEMRGFKRGGHGIAELADRQIDDLVAYLRSLEQKSDGEILRVAKSPYGRPEKGALLFEQSCTGCHGTRGEGASGPALSNPGFLRFASDGFLLATMALGRHGTEMRPVKKGPQSILELSSDEVNDLVAFLRSWEADPHAGAGKAAAVAHRFVVPWDLERGRQLYASNCAGCHGVGGKGSWAPELNNEGFLAAATDGFLQATIARGRKGTAMRPFARGGQGLGELGSDDIDDLVAYIRSWSKAQPSPMTIPAERSRKGNEQPFISASAFLEGE
ncbi:MAG: c-type cytochrome [Planctomycetes bacterium]|nr:c-type cytochrome [Planctomycetota bacterium]